MFGFLYPLSMRREGRALYLAPFQGERKPDYPVTGMPLTLVPLGSTKYCALTHPTTPL